MCRHLRTNGNLLNKPSNTLDLLEPVGPTETQDWLRCPSYWHLNRNWEQSGTWKPHLALGAAIGVGLNHLLQGTPDQAENQAVELLQARFVENDEWTVNALEALVHRAIQEAAKTTVKDILATEKVLACELTVGKGRLDLVTRREPYLVITDHKTSLQMKSDYVLRNLTEASTDWQLWDYAYRAREYYQQRENIIVRRHLGVLTPRTKWYVHEVNIRPEVLDRWVGGAQNTWAAINATRQGEDRGVIHGSDGLTMNLRECHGRYGKCPFLDFCHSCAGDEKRAEMIYTRKVKS